MMIIAGSDTNDNSVCAQRAVLNTHDCMVITPATVHGHESLAYLGGGRALLL